MWMPGEIYKSECLAGNAVLPGTIAQACEATNVRGGLRLLRLHLYRGSTGWFRVRREGRSEFQLSSEQLFLLQRDKGAG